MSKSHLFMHGIKVYSILCYYYRNKLICNAFYVGMLITESQINQEFLEIVAYLIRYAIVNAYFLNNIDFTAFLSIPNLKSLQINGGKSI